MGEEVVNGNGRVGGLDLEPGEVVNNGGLKVEQSGFGGADDGEGGEGLGDGADLEEGVAGGRLAGFEVGVAVGRKVVGAISIRESNLESRSVGFLHEASYVGVQLGEVGWIGEHERLGRSIVVERAPGG